MASCWGFMTLVSLSTVERRFLCTVGGGVRRGEVAEGVVTVGVLRTASPGVFGEREVCGPWLMGLDGFDASFLNHRSPASGDHAVVGISEEKLQLGGELHYAVNFWRP